LLVKVKENVIWQEISKTTQYNTYNQTYTKKIEWTFTSPWRVHMSWNLWSWSSWKRVDLSMQVDWIWWYANTTSANSSNKIEIDFDNYQNKSHYEIWIAWYSDSVAAYMSNIYIVVFQYRIIVPQIPIIPDSVKTLWNLWEWAIYWMTKEWDYIWGIMLEESESATTGEIALWNAKWYIRVRFNWKYIKIPYYWN